MSYGMKPWQCAAISITERSTQSATIKTIHCTRLCGEEPDLSHMEKLGNTAFVHLPKTKREHKLLDRATKGVLLGFERAKSYSLYLSRANIIKISRNVSCMES